MVDWAGMQSCMQKVPLIFKASTVSRANEDFLTDTRSIFQFFTALAQGQDVMNNDFIKSICRRDYIYNQSIFPGQTYKVKILDDQYALFFESKELVSQACTLNDFVGSLFLVSRSEGKLVGNNDVFQKYISIISQHLNLIKG